MPAADLCLDVLMDELLLVLLLPLPEVPRWLLHVALALQRLLVGGVAGGRSRRQPVPGPLQLALALAVAQDGAWLGCAQALGVLVGLAQRGCAHVARVVVASSLSKEGKVSTFTTLGSSLSLSLSLSLIFWKTFWTKSTEIFKKLHLWHSQSRSSQTSHFCFLHR